VEPAGTVARVAVEKIFAGKMLMGIGRVLGLVAVAVVAMEVEVEVEGTVVAVAVGEQYGWQPTI
jgi:hypothetical protein